MEEECAQELMDELRPRGSGSEAAEEQDAFSLPDIDRLSASDFEAAVAALFARQGAAVVLTANANDGGADVIAVHDGRVTLVQVKHSGVRRLVEETAVADVLAALDIYREHLGGYSLEATVVTNCQLAGPAQARARESGVTIVGRSGLADLLLAHPVGLSATTAMAGQRAASFVDGVCRVLALLRPAEMK
jgi:HJR/Mrr/RecB family endonuclease